MLFNVTLEQTEDRWLVVEGKTEQEVLENIKEVITIWLWAENQKAVMQWNT